MSYVTPAPPKPRRIWPWIVGILALLAALCGGFVTALAVSEPREGVLPEPTPAPSVSPRPPVAKPKPKVDTEVVIGEGMWRVGVEIQPGEYRTSGMRPDAFLCYWHSAKDTGTENIVEQGTAASANEPGLITLKKGQFFKTSGCQDWVRS